MIFNMGQFRRISTLFVIVFLRISNLFFKKLIFKRVIEIWLGFWDLATLSLSKAFTWERSHADEHFCCSIKKGLIKIFISLFTKPVNSTIGTKIKLFIRRTTHYLSSSFKTFNIFNKIGCQFIRTCFI